MTRRIIATLVIGVACTATCVAQSDFSALTIKPGDVIYVTEPSGTQTTGRLMMLSPSMLTLDGREFRPSGTLKIEKRGDRLWNGMAIGLAVGAGLGVFAGLEECGVDASMGSCVLSGMAWGGAIGLLIDWGHAGRTTIYVGSAAPAQPVPLVRRLVGPGTRMLAVRLNFSR